MLYRCILSCVAASAVTASAVGQCVFDSMSDGSDGDFSPQFDTVIDLGLAATGSWDTPGDGNGVYDPDRWVVVFKYMAINIPPNLTVTFINHPSGAPVVWLASGDVVITGTVSLNGGPGFSNNQPFQFSKGGPGGFDGGAGGGGPFVNFEASCGFGPGGGGVAQGGEYANGANPYGNSSIIPLIGGSGGGGRVIFTGSTQTAGAGGGAILIASSGTISLLGTPSIQANGGGPFTVPAGSGGGIRLIAQTISGNGSLSAAGATGQPGGGPGRIRLEACDLQGYTGITNPPPSMSGPGPVIKLVNAPTLRVTMVNGQQVPVDPAAGVLTNEVVASNVMVTLMIEATNIPVGTQVKVLVTPAQGVCDFVISTPLAGSIALSTAQAEIMLTEFPTEIHLKANWVP